jgi:hypothetical protein
MVDGKDVRRKNEYSKISPDHWHWALKVYIIPFPSTRGNQNLIVFNNKKL